MLDNSTPTDASLPALIVCMIHGIRAIRNDPSKLVLQHSLARLLLALGQVRPATSLLDTCLEAHKTRQEGGGGTNLEALALDVDT
jgi:hypothetical protein